TPTTTTTAAAINQVAPTTRDPAVGTPIGLMTIPRMGMDGVAIVEGTDENQLQQGPGHYVGTALPGQAGNAAIAGHRTTYGAPFYNLNELQPGDPIMIQTSQGTFTYRVVNAHVVSPSTAATRLVVLATLTAAALTTPPTVPTSAPPSSSSSTTVTLPKSLGGAA